MVTDSGARLVVISAELAGLAAQLGPVLAPGVRSSLSWDRGGKPGSFGINPACGGTLGYVEPPGTVRGVSAETPNADPPRRCQ